MNQFPVIVTKYSEKLKEGDVYKNYKDLCNQLCESELKANSKKAQIKEWQRHFDFEKVGQKYIITEIYLEPLPKDDKRINNGQSIYSEHVELLLLDYLSRQKGKVAELTIKNIFLLLGMVNNNYMNDNYKIDDDLINDFQINHFYQRSYKKLNRILFDTLRSLKNKRLINFNEDKVIKISELNREGFFIDNIRIATQDEKNIIMKVEHEVLQEMGYDTIVQIHLKFKNKEFYKKVKESLYEQYKIHFYFNQISLWFYHEHIEHAKEKAKIDMERKMLNSKVVNFVNEQVNKNLEKIQINYDEAYKELMEDCIGEPSPFKVKKIFKLDEEVYRYSQQQLAEYLLRI